MKAGIITFHDTLNYGASLQCYALQKKMNSIGMETEVIDYKCEKFKRFYSPFLVSEKTFTKFIYMLVAMPMNLIKHHKKNRFQKKFLPISKSYNKENIVDANKEFDLFITGSDQVWNWRLTGFDATFFLDFVAKEKKKYSYAASFGFSELDEDKIDKYKELLSGYSAMSVREQSGVELVKKLTGDTVSLVLDPVFLLNKDEWIAITEKVNLDNYILLYTINDTKAYNYAVNLSKKTGKKLVYFTAPLKAKGTFIAKRNTGPIDFLSLLQSADLVVTDSFHGTAFSIIFEKKFVSLLANQTHNGNSRLNNLLSMLELENRIVGEDLSLNSVLEEIDYDKVKEKINTCVSGSISFLEQIIRENK